MKITNQTNNEERQILIGMIVDTNVLSRISVKFTKRMFKSKWSNTVASWCLKYFDKYNQAPKTKIKNLFEQWSRKSQDDNNIEIIESFLTSLSDEYETLAEESNSDFVIDCAGKYFKKIQTEKLIEAVQGNLDLDETDEAVNLINNFNTVELGVGEGIDILSDQEAWKTMLEQKGENLIKYPGALNDFFKHQLQRDSFISFMGPDKSGKSFWLSDLAVRAMQQRRKVAFFEVGDMSQNQIMKRIICRIAGRPFYPCEYNYPLEIYKEDGDNYAEIDYDVRQIKKTMTFEEVQKACDKMIKKKLKSKDSYFKLSCHPNSTISVRGIRNILKIWERDNWTPDVIVIDYADILDMNCYGVEGREKIDGTWRDLRRLSQEQHCLVATATQSDAKAYKTKVITKENFSDCKTKIAHITGMIGINVTPQEKKSGITRLNWVAAREGEYNEYHCINVAGCLAIANPAIKSTF